MLAIFRPVRVEFHLVFTRAAERPAITFAARRWRSASYVSLFAHEADSMSQQAAHDTMLHLVLQNLTCLEVYGGDAIETHTGADMVDITRQNIKTVAAHRLPGALFTMPDQP